MFSNSSKCRHGVQKAVYGLKAPERMMKFHKKEEKREEKLSDGISVNQRKERSG